MYHWEANLETGHEKIDNQHKQLISMLNDLINASKNENKDEIFKVMEFLTGYVVLHFKTEEDLQLKYEYDDYYIHKQYHDEFKNSVKKLTEQLVKEGASNELVNIAIKTIGDWFINHIKGDDFRMAAFIKSKE
ncbi:MAG: hemerythrin family protein [Treponema sp.]|jgi:hemerythrin|nr:hemerythrin family protein [Treponema sp.]